MKIRLNIDITGSHDGKRWPARGGIVDVADNVAARMIANGQATAVEDAPVETAVTPTDDVEERADEGPLTTSDGPVKRPRGRPRKKQD